MSLEVELIRRAREFRKQKRYAEGVKLLHKGAESLSVFCAKFNWFYDMCMKDSKVLHLENAMTLCSSASIQGRHYISIQREKSMRSTLVKFRRLLHCGILSNCVSVSLLLSSIFKDQLLARESLLRECAYGQRHYAACQYRAKTSDDFTKTLLYLLSENTDAIRLRLEPKEDSDERLRELYLIGGHMHQNRHLRDALYKPNNDAVKSFSLYLEYTARIRKSVLCWMELEISDGDLEH